MNADADLAMARIHRDACVEQLLRPPRWVFAIERGGPTECRLVIKENQTKGAKYLRDRLPVLAIREGRDGE